MAADRPLHIEANLLLIKGLNFYCPPELIVLDY